MRFQEERVQEIPEAGWRILEALKELSDEMPRFQLRSSGASLEAGFLRGQSLEQLRARS